MPEASTPAASSAPAARTAPAGFWRRSAAMFYDSLLLLAVLMLFTALVLLFTHGQAISSASAGWLEYGYRLLLLGVIVGYFGISWTRGGQTLGMQAWRIRVMRADGSRMRWRDVVRRLAAALLSWLP